jgi:hypothetical protein
MEQKQQCHMSQLGLTPPIEARQNLFLMREFR